MFAAAFLFAATLRFAQPYDVAIGRATDKVVDASEPFEALALTWSSMDEAAVRVRVSNDGITWSDWTPLTIDDDLTDRSAGRYRTAIAHFGEAALHAEVSFHRPVDRVTVAFFPPAPPRERTIASFTLGALRIRSRVDWGCPDGEGAPLWTPVYTTVTHAVVHHTAGANSVPNWDAELRNIWYFHTFSNGWGDIGYNYLIDPDGVIYEGRAGGEGAIGAHFSCRNTNTAGIALLGTFSTVSPSAAALNSLRALLTEICRRHGIDPTAVVLHVPSQLNVPTILGHRDGNPSPLTCTRTECPGDVLYAMLPAIRQDVFAALNAPPPPRRRAVRP